jgi:putative CocE/NonD family hydrolase
MGALKSTLRVTWAASVLLLPFHFLHASEAKESRPGVYRGYSEARFSEWQKTSRYVAMSDGVKLAVDIYRPAVKGRAVDEKFPVVWVHTPYRRAYTDPQGTLVNPLERLELMPLLKYGYVVAAVDTRGRGASFGARRGFQDRTEARDAYEMTEWFAKQPWSTGEIGVAGCSYLGGSTWHAATMMAPHLKAIAPGCTDFDKYGFVSRGGITAQFNTRPENPGQDFGQGVVPVSSDTDGKQAEAAIAEHLKGTPMAELWAGMRYRDDVSPLLGVPFWRESSVATYAKEIERSGVGIFIWGNWLDEGSFEATLAFNNLNNPRKIWMGEWAHCQVGDFPMAIEMLRFFDYFLKKIDNGWQREAPIYYRTVNAPVGKEWSSTDKWPLANARNQTLHLGGGASPGVSGQLSNKAASTTAASDKFVVDYDPHCSGKVDLYFLMWPCSVDKHGLGYTTPALTADAHIAGHPIADLWISSTTNDADLFVYLEDVATDGTVSIVTHGRLRASHRGEQPAPYRNFMGLPYHRGERRDAEPLTPGKPARLRLDLLPTSTIIKAGHRLRLTIAGADPRQRSRNVKFDPAPTLAIYHDREHASQLTLPVVGAFTAEVRGE